MAQVERVQAGRQQCFVEPPLRRTWRTPMFSCTDVQLCRAEDTCAQDLPRCTTWCRAEHAAARSLRWCVHAHVVPCIAYQSGRERDNSAPVGLCKALRC